jgi:hypothetical protein
MKAIQVSIDEELLHRLDADPEVQRDGRSAVLRRAVTAYLQERRAERIADAYRRGYGDSGGIRPEFDGWEEEGNGPRVEQGETWWASPRQPQQGGASDRD